MEKKPIDLKKSVYELCSNDDALPGILSELGFTDITKPGMLQTAGRFMTLPKGAQMKKIDLSILKEKLMEKGYDIKE